MQRSVLGMVRYVGRIILLTFVVLYFLIDLLFLSILRPLRARFMALQWIERLRESVGKLNRYVALVILLVPWLLLEPIKPIGFLLFTHKHHFASIMLIIGGEIVKLAVFEQLFDMTKPKLMSFGWFAWCYNHWQAAVAYLRSLPVWQRMLHWYHAMRIWLRHFP